MKNVFVEMEPRPDSATVIAELKKLLLNSMDAACKLYAHFDAKIPAGSFVLAESTRKGKTTAFYAEVISNNFEGGQRLFVRNTATDGRRWIRSSDIIEICQIVPGAEQEEEA